MEVLIAFRHGLGDAKLLLDLLPQLRHRYPDWQIDLLCLREVQQAFQGHFRRVHSEPCQNGITDFIHGHDRRYQKIFDLETTEVSAKCQSFLTQDFQEMTMPHKVLLITRHGLGDAAQTTAVLKHLRHYHPDWHIEIAALKGKHSCYFGLCERAYNLDKDLINRAAYEQIFDLHWYESHESYTRWPSTKVEKCLLEVFRLDPIPELCTYTIHPTEQARGQARAYLESVCGPRPLRDGKFPAVCFHYEGNTSADHKNLGHDDAAWICERLIEAELVPIILDWETPLRSPLPDGRRIFNPRVDHPLWQGFGTGDGGALAALIDQCCLMIGVDSGPLHIAAATSTPTVAIWTRHHPIHYLCPAENVTNLVPPDHQRYIRGDQAAGLAYFTEHYQFRPWQSFRVDCKQLIDELLSGPQKNLTRNSGFWVRRDNVPADMVIVQDVYTDDCYRLGEVPLPREVIVDGGAHIGAFAARARARNPFARIICVEACPENWEALQQNVGSYAEIVQAALTCEISVALLNAVWPHCVSTGGSIVVSPEEAARYKAAGPECDKTVLPDGSKREYWSDARPIKTITLDQLAAEKGFDHVDLLKLDIEGSEYSLLRGVSQDLLDRTRLIVGEYHGRFQFDDLVRDRFQGWKLEILRDGHFGLFRLSNPAYSVRA